MPGEISTVLLVDDEEIIRLTLAAHLQDRGFQVLQAETGRQGLELFASHRPDVALIDLRLPELDGLDLLAKIHEMSPVTPAIVVSGAGTLGDAIAAIKHGAWDYVAKPIQDMTILDHALDKALDRKRLYEENRRYQDQLEAEIGERTAQLEQTQKHLAERNTFLAALLETLPTGIVEIDAQGTILFANAALESIYGYGPGEMIGMSILDLLVSDEERDLMRKLITRLLEEQPPLFPVQSKRKRKDGSIIEVEVDWNYKRNDAAVVEGFIASVTDITASKKAEAELRQNEETLRKILEGIKVGIIVVDPGTFSILDMNSVAQDMVGMTRKELAGKPCGHIKWLRENGEEYAESCNISDGHPVSAELRIARPDGRIIPVTKTVIPAVRDNRLMYYEVLFDLTQRKALERQLVMAQRLESIGALASGIAHEINTPIQYIGDNLTYLEGAFTDLVAALRRCEQQAGPPASGMSQDLDFLLKEMPEALSQSLEGVARVTAIVQAMKRFAHPGSEEKTPLDVNKAIENTVVVARNEWKYHAEVLLDLDPALEFFPCFAGDFNQVVLNMLINAAHAVNEKYKDRTEKGLIRIRTEKEGEFLKVVISDTGCGIPAQNLHRIYDPFFTTKEVGKGTGQGLAIAHDIVVDKHGGTIDVESEEGEGTTFTLRFPLSQGAQAVR